MIIYYFSLFIPLLFLSTESSSIRNRSPRNELVPFLNSRVDPLKRDLNSLKIVSNEPFVIQLQMPNSKERESKRAYEKDKKRKRPMKKRISKIKPLRKKHRARRELLTSPKKIEEQKSNRSEVLHAVNATEQQFTNLNKNLISRTEILKALSSYSKKIDTKRSKFEDVKNFEKVKHNQPSRNLHNRDSSHSDQTSRVKMIYPSTPKPDQHQHKYTYKDLMADRERLEQKIKYIKNMLNVSDSDTDDTIRVRRKSDSDRTANKIAKMFLTLSAVNGLHDRRKSKCQEDDEEDRVRDDWEKERRNNPTRKSSSSNEERYKVKKWIEYMKNKRSSSKTCPCMANDEERDIFPLEQKLPKGYFQRGKSSEESSESYSDPFYSSRDKLNNNNFKNGFEKSQDPENKLTVLAKNGKKKLELPFDDLEIYRTRAKQILQNAEEILDRIKAEEEKRLYSPNILMNQLKELTSRIHTDPRNNENDLIRKIQKNLGWGALAKSNTDDNTFIDNVKSLILEPYEKAKALTDESTKKLSSYLLRNLGKLQKCSEEQEEGKEETARKNLQKCSEQIPQENTPVSASLAKEDSTPNVNPKEEENQKNYGDTLLVNLSTDDKVNKESNQEEIFKQRMEDIIKEQQKKVDEYKVNQNSEENSQEVYSPEDINEKVAKIGIESEGERESGRSLENEEMALKSKLEKENENDEEKVEKLMTSDSTKKPETEDTTKNAEDAALTLKKIPESLDVVEKKKKTDETSFSKKDETNVTASENVSAQEKIEEEVKKNIKTNNENIEKDKLDLVVDDQEIINIEEREKEENVEKEKTFHKSADQKLGQKKENAEEKNQKEEFEKADTSINSQETNSEENTRELKSASQKQKEESILLLPHDLLYDDDNEDPGAPSETNENLKDKAKAISQETFDEAKSVTETILRKQGNADTEINEEDSAKTILGENNFMQDNVKELPDSSQNSKGDDDLKETKQRQEESPEDKEKQDLSNAETTQTGIQDEESTHEYKQFLESNHSKNIEEESSKIEEQSKKKTERDENQNLTMENPDVERDRDSEYKREKEKAVDGIQKKISENLEKLEKKLNENESKSDMVERDQENLNEKHKDIPLREILKENSSKNLDESEKSIQENRESFDETSEDGNQIQAVEFENRESKTKQKSTTDETFLKEALENTGQYEKENDDTKLEAKKPIGEKSNESLDQSKNEDVDAETTLNKENKNNEETESKETLSRATVNTQSDERVLDVEDADDTTLRKTFSKEDKNKEVNEKLTYSNEKGSSETNLKLGKKEDSDLDGSSEVTNSNQNINGSSDGETENIVKEISDKNVPKYFQKKEEGGEQSTLKSERIMDNLKNQEKYDKGDSNETTLKVALKEKEVKNLDEETDEETISTINSKDSKEVERVNENDEEVALHSGKTQSEDRKESQNHESLLSSSEQDILKEEQSEGITLQEEAPDEKNQENQIIKNSEDKDEEKKVEEHLKKENQKILKLNDSYKEESDQDQKSKEESSNESSKEILSKKAQENLNESLDDETLSAAKLNEKHEQNQENDGDENYLESTLEYNDQKSAEETDDTEIIKEESSKDSEQRQDNFSNEASVGKVLDEQEQATEMNDDKIERNLNENISNQDEDNSGEADDEDTTLKMAKNSEENNKETDRDNRHSSENDREGISFESAVESQKQEKKEMGSDETVKALNLKDDQEKEELSSEDDGTSLKTTSTENESNNKVENESTFLKSEKVEEKKNEAELKQNDTDESEETLREKNIADELSNQIDQESEDGNLLRSKNFDETNEEESEKSLQEESYETLTAKRPSIKNLSAEDDYESQLRAATSINRDNSPDLQEKQKHSSISDLIQKTDSTKTDQLKVPKSIGKIMKDLEGKEKDDITSFRNLNPEKIDHIIDKIDEAEQQNLRQSLEVDCRKECACADEIDTKSRNIGRYEIVKDFLFWMKDLQLHRVLSDD